MKKPWHDPTKRPASEATLQVEGNFDTFKGKMQRLLKVKPSGVSRAPVAAPKGTS